MELQLDGVEVEVQILAEACDEGEWLLNAIVQVDGTADIHRAPAVCCIVFHIGELLRDFLRHALLWVSPLDADRFVDSLLRGFELDQDNLGKGSFVTFLEVDGVDHLDLTSVWAENPVLLILSVWNFAWFEWFFVLGFLHGVPDWCTQEVALEAGELISQIVNLLLSLDSDCFILCSNLGLRLLVVLLVDFLSLGQA